MTVKVLTVKDVAEMFPRQGKRRAVGEDAIRKALEDGKLGGRKIGNMWFTTESAVERWLSGLKPEDSK